MSLNKDLAEALAGTVAKEHPAFRDSLNWEPYRGPRGGEGYINTYTGDVVYGDEKPGRGWDNSGEIEVDESFRSAPDGYQWERAPMNYDVKNRIEEANPDNVDGFLESEFSGDQIIYEAGQNEEAPHEWGRVEGARVDSYTNLGGHEVTGVVLELEGGDEAPLSRVRKHVNTSKEPKYEMWQLAGDDPDEMSIEEISEKVYHSASHDKYEWKEYADWRNEAKSLPVMSEKGRDNIFQAIGIYFDHDTVDTLRGDLGNWKSDSSDGHSNRYTGFAAKAFDIDAPTRGDPDEDYLYGDDMDEEAYKQTLEVLADVSRRFYEDQYEGNDLYRGISRHGFRSLVKGWLENPGAEKFEVEHQAVANYTADHRVARDWARNTAVISPSIDSTDIILTIDGLNTTGVHNTESEVHMRGDTVTVRPDDVKIKTSREDVRRGTWPERQAGLDAEIDNWHKSDYQNFGRAISLIYENDTPDEETAGRFLRIANGIENEIERAIESDIRSDFERDDFFVINTNGPGEYDDEVIEWQSNYQDLLARIEEQYGLTVDSVQKAENPPGSPDETVVVDLTRDWFLSPKYRHNPERAEKDVSNVTGEWVPYQGPRGGEGWQRVSDQEVVYQEDPPGDVVEGYEGDFWERYGEDDEVKDPSGYYDPEAWDEAFPDMAIDSPSDVPEGTEVHYVSATNNHHVGRVTGYQYGQKNPEGVDEAYLEVTSEDGYEAAVPAHSIEDIRDLPHEEESIPEFEWDTDVPRIDEMQEDVDVLYEGENGVRRVGQYERPTFVQTDEGTFGGAVLEDGTEIRLQDMIAVDEGPVPLEPRDDPYEFESVVNEGDFRGLRGPDETWDNLLEFTPFDGLGEVPIGAKVEFDTRKLNGTIEGEVTGYIDYDASIGETNSLRVETDDDYVGEATVGPSNFVRFIGPEGDQDLTLDEYLRDPFQHAHKVEGSREAGIRGGNTTGDRMEIITMPDDSLIFATPLEAYNNITTGVVDSAAEARENNLNSPIMINHLGGNGCKTEVVEGPDGKQYIAKEGIPGDDLKSRQFSIDRNDDADLYNSLARTSAAAFFVGNQDLHAGNIRVNFDTQEATIIDHDAAGGTSFGGFMSIKNITNDPLNVSDVQKEVYDIARGYMSGDTEIPKELQGTNHESYFREAIDELANDESHSDLFEPWNGDPHSLPRHADSMDDFSEGQEVTVLTNDGHVRTGELTDRYQGTWYGETEDGYEISFDMPHHVLTSEEPQIPIEPTEESEQFMDALTGAGGQQENEYDDITDLETGMGITINQGFGEEEVVVEEIDEGSPFPQMLVRPTDGDDPFHVNQMDDIVRVGHDSVRDIDSEGYVQDLAQLNTGENVEAVDQNGEEYSGTFMGYEEDSGEIQVQDEPGRIVTIEPENVRLTGDSE